MLGAEAAGAFDCRAGTESANGESTLAAEIRGPGINIASASLLAERV